MAFKFGDLIENGWAGDGNPTKVGVFVWYKRRTGRMNPGKWAVITDMKGKTWEVCEGEGHKLTVVGSVLATSTDEPREEE